MGTSIKYRGIRRMLKRKTMRTKAGKPTVKKIASQVKTLIKRVNHNTAVQHLTEKVNEISIVDGPYIFSNLTNWSLKTAVFATGAVDWQNSNKLFHKRITMDCRITAGNEYDLIGYRVFLVSLLDGANVPSRWNAGTGGLALNPGLDYAISPFGKAMLNPKVFKIHKVKSFFTSNYGANAGTTGNTGNQLIKEWKWTIYPRHTVYNPSGNVATMTTSQDPSKCYYILIFNDNSSADLQAPVFSCQLYHSVIAAQ